MSTALDDDKLNPANTSTWDDERGAPAIKSARDGEQANFDRELDGITNDSNISDLKNAEGSGGNKSATDGNIEKKKEEDEEESGFKKRLKKSGPLIGVGGIIAAFMGTASFFGLPAALLVTFEGVLTNANSHDTRANTVLMRGRMGAMFNNMLGTGRDCSASKIKCKVATMGNRELKRLKAIDGVEVETNKSKKNPFRNKVRKMSIPLSDGTKVEVKNAAEFNQLMRDNPDFRRTMFRVQHPIASAFIGVGKNGWSKFKDKILKKYNINMGDKFKASKKKDPEERDKENKKNMNEKTGADTDKDKNSRIDKYKKKLKTSQLGKAADKAKGGIRKAAIKSGAGGIAAGVSLATMPVELACMSYNIIRASVATIKVAYMKDLVSFAYPFFRIASQLRNQGDVDPTEAEYVGKRVGLQVTKSSDSSIVGKNATDSQGFQAALNGDASKLKDHTKKLMPWYMVGGVKGSELIKGVQETLGGKKNIRNMCIAATIAGFATGAISGVAALAQCATIVGCIAPIAGMILGFVGGAVLADIVVDQAIEALTSESAQRIVEAGLDADLVGPPLGDALAGAMAIMGTEKDRASGLRPATSTNEVLVYNKTTESYYQDYLAFEKDEAGETPLNPYREFSFANQFIKSMYPDGVKTDSIGGMLGNLTTIAMTPMKLLGGSAASAAARSSGYYMPNPITDDIDNLKNAISRCEDVQMEEVGFICDMHGRPVSVIDPRVLGCADKMAKGEDLIDVDDEGTKMTKCFSDMIDYMTDNDYIDEEGKPTKFDTYSDCGGEEEKKCETDYLYFKAYCTEDRVYPWGTSVREIDSDMMSPSATKANSWRDGVLCSGKNEAGEEDRAWANKIYNFSFYYNFCESQLSLPESTDGCWEDEEAGGSGNEANTSSAEKNTGDWEAPATGTCDAASGGFGSRGGAHKGIDISAPSGTPLLAPTSMKIIFVGVSSDGSTGNQVTATATDGSDYSFRFMHMLEKGPMQEGQEVSKGTEIGKIGSTGDSTGPHLHLDVFPPNVDPMSYGGQVDPIKIFQEHGVTIPCP